MMWIDHLIAVVLIAVAPVYAVWSWRRFVRELERDPENTRLSSYAETILVEWGVGIAVLIAFFSAGRTPVDLGLTTPWTTALGVSTLLVAITSIFLLSQVSSVRALEGTEAVSVRTQFEKLELMMPHTLGERDVFMVVAVTAGMCEELLYRGFLMYYMTPALGMWGAVGASSVVFGLGHAYQGGPGIVKTSIAGLVLGALYAVSGSIWPGIVLHAVLDIQGGLIGYEVFGRATDAEPIAPQTEALVGHD